VIAILAFFLLVAASGDHGSSGDAPAFIEGAP